VEARHWRFSEDSIPRVALLPEEPPGRVATRAAGLALVEAILLGKPGSGAPPTVPREDPPTDARVAVTEAAETPDVGRRTLRFELRALDSTALAETLESVLRRVTAHAAIHEAVLEARAVHFAAPRVLPARLVEALGARLWRETALPVRFGPVWTPLPPAWDLAVGVGGPGDAFREALAALRDLKLSAEVPG